MARFENSTQKAQREGRESRARVISFLAEALTDPNNPLNVEQLNELRYLQFYFPDLSKPIADVVRRYSDRPDLPDALLHAAAVQAIGLLIDPAKSEPKVKAG
jgi:hypothetical protein